MKDWPVTDVWNEYQRGVDYKQLLKLYQTVDENYRFYEGDQWHGINVQNLPTPVFNIIKPSGKFMVVQIKDRKLVLQYNAEGITDEDVKAITKQMSALAKRTWDRLGMEYKNLEGLTDAFCSGDYILYHWWNDEKETGQEFQGDVDSMIIDNVNYYPGNPNSSDVQGQPYIIIAFRELVENVKKMASNNGVKDLSMIVEDTDTDFTAGDLGKVEIDKAGKCNVLLRMWKEKGEVHFAKYTKYLCVQPKTKANLKLYPIAVMNWNPRKNCCHGVAEVTYLKANQTYINKQMAFTQLYLLQASYPKVVYNKALIPEWSNKVAAAIGVSGSIEHVASYMQPPQIPFDVWKGFETTLQQTMELIGANDAALGNIANPDNKSAFIAIREAAIVPLQAQQERFRQMMKEVGLIWLDFWIHHYGENRMIQVELDGIPADIPFEVEKYKNLVYDTVVEVGESQMWSELNVVQTMDNLLAQGQIRKSQYYKRMPQGYIPDKQELIDAALKEEAMQDQAQMMQLGLPPEGAPEDMTGEMPEETPEEMMMPDEMMPEELPPEAFE